MRRDSHPLQRCAQSLPGAVAAFPDPADALGQHQLGRHLPAPLRPVQLVLGEAYLGRPGPLGRVRPRQAMPSLQVAADLGAAAIVVVGAHHAAVEAHSAAHDVQMHVA